MVALALRGCEQAATGRDGTRTRTRSQGTGCAEPGARAGRPEPGRDESDSGTASGPRWDDPSGWSAHEQARAVWRQWHGTLREQLEVQGFAVLRSVEPVVTVTGRWYLCAREDLGVWGQGESLAEARRRYVVGLLECYDLSRETGDEYWPALQRHLCRRHDELTREAVTHVAPDLLGLPARFRAALIRAGLTTWAQVAALTDAELWAVPRIGRAGLLLIRAAQNGRAPVPVSRSQAPGVRSQAGRAVRSQAPVVPR